MRKEYERDREEREEFWAQLIKSYMDKAAEEVSESEMEEKEDTESEGEGEEESGGEGGE